ncbi:MAG: FIG00635988: hypothetical protein, partial [uncultured Sphingosinicella sp.]
GLYRSPDRPRRQAAGQDHPRPGGARPREAGTHQGPGQSGDARARNPDEGDRRRSEQQGSLDQPRPPELPLRHVHFVALVDPDGPHRGSEPRHGAGHRPRHERVSGRHPGGTLRALRHRLSRLHRRARLGKSEGRGAL